VDDGLSRRVGGLRLALAPHSSLPLSAVWSLCARCRGRCGHLRKVQQSVVDSRRAMSERATIRCPHCRLMQFVTHDGHCRKCHLPFVVTVLPAPLPIPERVIEKYDPQVFCHENVVSPTLPIVLTWLRHRAGLSQAALASRMHSPRTFISKIESGTSEPTINSFMRYCDDGLSDSLSHVLLLCESVWQAAGLA
jgi:hypothetical protein